MPYENQFGSKTAHSDVVRNPEVQAFLRRCRPLQEPSKLLDQELSSSFIPPHNYDNGPNVNYIIASDGSFYSSSIDNRIPSIQVCYLKFSTILIEMLDFHGLEDSETRLIDPFRVASLQRNKDTLSLVLPLSNFRLPGDDSVKSTFRRQTEAFLWSEATRFRKDDRETSLMGTLIELAQLRPDATTHPGHILIHKCPSAGCAAKRILLDPNASSHLCAACNKPLYISDCLRLWEAVNDYHPNQEPASRLMTYVEHLLPIHYLRFLRNESPTRLSELCMLIDGPLGIFGQAAWLHQSIMRFLHELRDTQTASGLANPVLIGLQKSGYLVEYLRHIAQAIPNDRLFSVDDEFRHKYLGIERSGNGFGSETYYGQDFAFKTPTGKIFVFALPYPFGSKSQIPNFRSEKADIRHYTEIGRALHLIAQVETDLYRNAVVPIALAHKYAAISLKPGGRVLDIMGKAATKPT